MNSKIFISVGSRNTDKQKQFVDAVVTWLQAEGYDPIMLGKTVYPHKQPLRYIQEKMSECDGTLVIAFERVFVKDGDEKRGSPEATELKGQIIPTVWNQTETAMAYGLGQPILVLSEEGSRREGLLDQCFDWLVFPVKIEDSTVVEKAFIETMRGWFSQVRAYRTFRETKRPIAIPGNDPCELQIGDLIRMLTVRQIIKYSALIISTFCAILGILGALVQFFLRYFK